MTTNQHYSRHEEAAQPAKWQAFLDHLHQGGTHGYWWTNPSKVSTWYPVGQYAPIPAGECVYFGVNPSSIPPTNDQGEPIPEAAARSRKWSVQAVNTLFAEFDAKDFVLVTDEEIDARVGDISDLNPAQLRAARRTAGREIREERARADPETYKGLALEHIKSLPRKPSAVVDSGGGYHCYWLLRETYHITGEDERGYIDTVQSSWVTFVQGDPGAKDLPRVLRLPGTLNHKYDPPRPVSFIELSLERRYDLAELDNLIPKEAPQAAGELSMNRRQYGEGESVIDAYNQAVKIEDILTHYGYKVNGRHAVRPGGEHASVYIRDGRSYHHNSNDPLCDGYWKSPFSIFCILEHDGDTKQAVKAAAEQLGIARTGGNGHTSNDPPPPEFPDDWGSGDIPPAEFDDYSPIDEPLEQVDAPEANPALEELYEQIKASTNGDRPALLLAHARTLAASRCDSFTLDEWARKLKEFTPVTDYKAEVKKQLKAQAEAQTRRAARQADDEPAQYLIRGSRTIYLKPNMMGMIDEVVIADLVAKITGEIEEEDGDKTFVITGKTATNRLFKLEMAAREYADVQKLEGAIVNAGGADAIIRPGMGKHLKTAIQTLSDPDRDALKRYRRTGWNNGRFLIPGREQPGEEISLPDELAYRLDPSADLPTGIQALNAILECMNGAEQTGVLVANLLLAPLARLGEWGGEDIRCGTFIVGETGRLKTSVTQAAMSIYGRGFMYDRNLIKLGEGATNNAIMKYATYAHDMPMLVDNYKPSTGGGEKAFIGLLHNILEGGEKKRLDRASNLKENRPVFCWPVVTGEDVPHSDSATLARMLVIEFDWEKGKANEKLAFAQEHAIHLPAVGASWLEWLESGQAQKAIQDASAQFTQLRARWSAYLMEQNKDVSNPLRIATALAINHLAWWIAEHHPQLGATFIKHHDAHQTGLVIVAARMAESTAEAREAYRYIATLKQLIGSGRYILLPRSNPDPANQIEADRLLGWRDANGIYLFPDLARTAVETVLGKQGLGSISAQQLHSQLNGLGLIARRDETSKQWARQIRIGASNKRLLHLVPDALDEAEDESKDSKAADE